MADTAAPVAKPKAACKKFKHKKTAVYPKTRMAGTVQEYLFRDKLGNIKFISPSFSFPDVVTLNPAMTDRAAPVAKPKTACKKLIHKKTTVHPRITSSVVNGTLEQKFHHPKSGNVEFILPYFRFPATLKKSEMHPKYSEMIQAAIDSLNERGGSSRKAIMRYIRANYWVGDKKQANDRLKCALKAGVKNGDLKQFKRDGASGSSKFGVAKKTPKPKKASKLKAAKNANRTKAKKPAAKKTAKPKKVKPPTKAATKQKKAAGSPKKARAATKPKKAKTPKKKAAANT